MDFIDEQDDLAGAVHHFLDHAFEALLKLSLIFCTRNQGAHIQGIYLLGLQVFRHLPVHDVLGDAFRNGGLAHAGLAHQDGVVLGAPGKDLQHTPYFVVPADNRIQLALRGPLVEVDRKAFQKITVIVFVHNPISFAPFCFNLRSFVN